MQSKPKSEDRKEQKQRPSECPPRALMDHLKVFGSLSNVHVTCSAVRLWSAYISYSKSEHTYFWNAKQNLNPAFLLKRKTLRRKHPSTTLLLIELHYTFDAKN